MFRGDLDGVRERVECTEHGTGLGVMRVGLAAGILGDKAELHVAFAGVQQLQKRRAGIAFIGIDDEIGAYALITLHPVDPYPLLLLQAAQQARQLPELVIVGNDGGGWP